MLDRQQAIIWTSAGPTYWCIYGALGGDNLSQAIGSDNDMLPIPHQVIIRCEFFLGLRRKITMICQEHTVGDEWFLTYNLFMA